MSSLTQAIVNLQKNIRCLCLENKEQQKIIDLLIPPDSRKCGELCFQLVGEYPFVFDNSTLELPVTEESVTFELSHDGVIIQNLIFTKKDEIICLYVKPFDSTVPYKLQLKNKTLKSEGSTTYDLIVSNEFTNTSYTESDSTNLSLFNFKNNCELSRADQVSTDAEDTWPFVGRNLTNNSYHPNSTLTETNVVAMDETKIRIASEEGGTAETFIGGMVVDEEFIYVTTFNDKDAVGAFTEASNLYLYSSGGYVTKINRTTGDVPYRVKFSDYTERPGDLARGIALHGDYLYMGSGFVFSPQTFVGLGGVIKTFDFPVESFGQQRKIVCVNKNDMTRQWVSIQGAQASNYDDPDNWLIYTQSPVVFNVPYLDYPVLAIGTSSGQSFVQTLMTSDTNPLVTSNFSLNPNGSRQTIGMNPATYTMTDVGRVFLINADTGDHIDTINLVPELYKIGNTLSADSIVPGHIGMKVWHIIEEADMATNGELNPTVSPTSYNYGTSKMTFTLLSNTGLPSASSSAYVLPLVHPLVGMEVTDNVGESYTITDGAVPNNLNLVVVTLDVVFTDDGREFTVVSTSVSYITANYVLQGYPALSGVTDTIGYYPVRIEKTLQVGHTLTKQDAYRCNYYGASAWGSSIVVNQDNNGNNVELYITSGQNHDLPLDEIRLFDVDAQPGQGRRYLERVKDWYDAQQTYITSPDEAKYNNILAEQAKTLQDMETNKAKVLSVRGKRNHHNSVIAVGLRQFDFAKILWANKTNGYDAWHNGFAGLSLRWNATEPPFAEAPAIGPLEGVTNPQEHFGILRAPDADYGEGCYLAKGKGFNNTDLLVAPSKGGTISVMNVDVKFGPSVLDERLFDIIGNAGALGGSNFGSCLYDDTIFVLNANENTYANINMNTIPDTTVIGGIPYDTLANLPTIFPLPLNWYPKSETVFDSPDAGYKNTRSYTTAYNFVNQVIKWEESVIPIDLEGLLTDSQFYTTQSNLSCNKDLLFIHAADSYLYVRKTSDGEYVTREELDIAGNSHAIPMKDELYICSGRSMQGSIGRGKGNYNIGSKFLYKFKVA
jgi:hypothetical protein